MPSQTARVKKSWREEKAKENRRPQQPTKIIIKIYTTSFITIFMGWLSTHYSSLPFTAPISRDMGTRWLQQTIILSVERIHPVRSSFSINCCVWACAQGPLPRSVWSQPAVLSGWPSNVKRHYPAFLSAIAHFLASAAVKLEGFGLFMAQARSLCLLLLLL